MTTALSPYPADARTGQGQYRRTNSLAFAKSDCHNCSSLGLHCDRQRPRCTTCQDASVLCQGYSMQLTWRSNHSMTNKPSKAKRKASSDKSAGASTPNKQRHRDPGTSSQSVEVESVPSPLPARQFMFVKGRPAKRRRQNHHSSASESGTAAEKPSTVDENLSEVRSLDIPLPPQTPGEPVQTHISEDLQDQDPETIVVGFPDAIVEEEQELSPMMPSPSILLNIPSPSPSELWNQTGLDWPAALTLPDHPSVDTIDSENIEQCLQIQQQPFDIATPRLEWNIQTMGSFVWDGASSSANKSPSSSSSSEGEEFTAMTWANNVSNNNGSMTFPPQMVFSTLHDKFYVLLDMYDQEFCKYPVTSDFCVNPYRYRPETTKGSRHLLHAIVAVACHFRQRTPAQLTPPADTIDHKNMAMALYQGALLSSDIHVTGLSLLDTALALWQVEAAISALNIWRSHITDAYNLLEVCGGIKRWSTSMRAHIQVSMLLWWDSMVSLLSGDECILPYSYLDTVLKSEGRQPWTFYELNGCPRELFVPMTQLANLAARQKKKKNRKQRRTSNDSSNSDNNIINNKVNDGTNTNDTISRLVAEIELSIRSYEYPGGGLSDLLLDGVDDEDGESLHAERDRFHCCEAFRYALLVYILRVFTIPREEGDADSSQPQPHVRARLSLLSRVALDHVAACRPTSAIQKQLLFPVFIAGVESRSQVQRELAADYCRRWYGKFGYQMYSTVLDVMEAVWAQQDAGNTGFWWGDELDARRAREGDYVQFCFG